MKGKCINLDCSAFDKVVDVPDGEDFICPECGHKLYTAVSTSRSMSSLWLWIILVIVTGGIAAWLLLRPTAESTQEENPEPTPPVNIAASIPTVNEGDSTILSYTGGNGKVFKWYSDSCGGKPVGEGNNLEVTPIETTTYYGRWENEDQVSDCKTTTVTVTVTDIAELTPPVSIAVSISTINNGESLTLSYTGGSGKIFKWYSDSCGGTPVGEGNNLEVTPMETTTYYGRWEDGDQASDCKTITVTVTVNKEENVELTPPVKIAVSNPTVNSGESTTLSCTGGSGKIFKWYSGSCGGTPVGEGNSLEVAPIKTTTYYGRWEDGDQVSDCKTATVTVKKKDGGHISGTNTYPFGKYTGGLKNGIPHGEGKMYYTKRVRIAKHASETLYAEKGDVFTGSWWNGDIEHGNLYDEKDKLKKTLFPGRRPNIYDISKD
jgi:predicted RNA-binding Zn-ribbon protein involved in translation (DUF1610 family)